jgi:hypothetical protein
MRSCMCWPACSPPINRTPIGIRKLAATSSVQMPDNSGKISNDLSERNTAALAFIKAQLRENFPAMVFPFP